MDPGVFVCMLWTDAADRPHLSLSLLLLRYLSPLMNWQSRPRLIFIQRYWAIRKFWLLRHVAHDVPLSLSLSHTYTHPQCAASTQINTRIHTNTLIHVYDLRSEAVPRWCQPPQTPGLPNRSITFSANGNDIIRPVICGVIHVDSHPLCSFPTIAFMSDSRSAL